MILPPPNWLRYDQENKLMIWEEILNADSYQFDVKPKISTEWGSFIVGTNEYYYDKTAGVYEAKGKTGNGGEWGPQSKLFEFIIE